MNRHLARLIERYPALASCAPELDAALGALMRTYAGGHKLMICGNGGSASDSEHIAGELMKGFMRRRPIPAATATRLEGIAGPIGKHIASLLQGALPAVALTSHIALSTAICNDTHSELVFAQQVYGIGSSGDALLGISTSGNAKNVLNAFVMAKALSITTIGLTGKGGGAILDYADVIIRAPAERVFEIQELHLPIYHALCMALEEEFFDSLIKQNLLERQKNSS